MNQESAYLSAVQYARTKHQEEHDRLVAAVEVAYAHGVPVADIAAAAGVHRTTIYRWLQELQPTNRKGQPA